ncbi:hypothetical protein D3C84_736190 [compost metagenome]
MHVVAHVGHVDEARGNPGAVGAGHRDWLNVLLVGDEGFRQRQTFNHLVVLADPVEGDVLGAVVAQAPLGGRWNEGVAAFFQGVRLALQGDVDFAFDDEQHRFGVLVQLRALAAAFWRQLHDVLREGFRETGQRTGDDPHAHLVPERQVAGDDVTHHALGDHGIGFGKHGTVCQQLGLSRVPTVRGVVRRFRHGQSRLVVVSPCLAAPAGAAWGCIDTI